MKISAKQLTSLIREAVSPSDIQDMSNSDIENLIKIAKEELDSRIAISKRNSFTSSSQAGKYLFDVALGELEYDHHKVVGAIEFIVNNSSITGALKKQQKKHFIEDEVKFMSNLADALNYNPIPEDEQEQQKRFVKLQKLLISCGVKFDAKGNVV